MKTLHLYIVSLFPMTCLYMNKVCCARLIAGVACIQFQPWIDLPFNEVPMHKVETTKKPKHEKGKLGKCWFQKLKCKRECKYVIQKCS